MVVEPFRQSQLDPHPAADIYVGTLIIVYDDGSTDTAMMFAPGATSNLTAPMASPTSHDSETSAASRCFNRPIQTRRGCSTTPGFGSERHVPSPQAHPPLVPIESGSADSDFGRSARYHGAMTLHWPKLTWAEVLTIIVVGVFLVGLMMPAQSSNCIGLCMPAEPTERANATASPQVESEPNTLP